MFKRPISRAQWLLLPTLREVSREAYMHIHTIGDMLFASDGYRMHALWDADDLRRVLADPTYDGNAVLNRQVNTILNDWHNHDGALINRDLFFDGLSLTDKAEQFVRLECVNSKICLDDVVIGEGALPDGVWLMDQTYLYDAIRGFDKPYIPIRKANNGLVYPVSKGGFFFGVHGSQLAYIMPAKYRPPSPKLKFIDAEF